MDANIKYGALVLFLIVVFILMWTLSDGIPVRNSIKGSGALMAK